ncbi:unnamed protein product, partial [Amoebophrya sp. A25]|eukprot:GSA25T00025166001.1
MDLFCALPIIEQSGGETVECLAYGCNVLYVGTSSGSVLSFTVAASNRTEEEVRKSGVFQRRVNLLRDSPPGNAGAAPGIKPGSGVAEIICPEGSNSRIFAVCESGIYILPGSLSNAGTVLAKNALCFALQTDSQGLQSTIEQFRGYDVDHAHICVCSKRKLHLFRPAAGGRPQDRGGAGDPDDVGSLKYELYQEIALERPGEPKEQGRGGPLLCRWQRRSIVLGFKREYVLVNQEDGSLQTIFQLDGVPRVLLLPEEEVLLLHQDRVGLFF